MSALDTQEDPPCNYPECTCPIELHDGEPCIRGRRGRPTKTVKTEVDK